jgi:hypothetical protein
MRQTMPVNLKAMPKARLHYSASAFDLGQKSLNIDMKIFVHFADMNREHGTQEQTAKARSWVHR